MSDQPSVASDQAPAIEIRSAKPLPDESNREAIEEMLWHAVQWAQSEEGRRWTDQVPVVKVAL